MHKSCTVVVRYRRIPPCPQASRPSLSVHVNVQKFFFKLLYMDMNREGGVAWGQGGILLFLTTTVKLLCIKSAPTKDIKIKSQRRLSHDKNNHIQIIKCSYHIATAIKHYFGTRELTNVEQNLNENCNSPLVRYNRQQCPKFRNFD